MPTSNAWRVRTIKAYITGICGFAGSWLAAELLRNGYYIRGGALPDESDKNLSGLGVKVKIDRFDITNAEACKAVLAKARPDYIFHLAAISSVGQSFSMAAETFRINVIGTHNILEAVKKRRLQKIVMVSSSDVYGPVRPNEIPLKPERLFNPVSPYARSKAAAEYMARTYIDQYDMPLTIVRPFNHTGPRQSPNFVIPAFCRKIVAAERSSGKKPVRVGNLKARRDISDVRDIVRGYRLMAEKGKVGQVYHLCSGKAHAVGDLLNKLIGFTDISVKVERDSKLYRQVDIPVLQGSYFRTKKELGWKPEIPIDRTLRDTLEYWRQQI